MVWLIAIALGLVFGLVTGGSIGRLSKLSFRWPWLIIAVVLIRQALLLTPLGRVAGARYIYVAALLAIIAWVVWHSARVRGIWLVAAGAALNVIVIVANNARMPVAPELAGAVLPRTNPGLYTLMGSQTNLNILGDWIRLGPIPEAYSVGDVLIALALAIVVFLAVRNPPPYKELTPP